MSEPANAPAVPERPAAALRRWSDAIQHRGEQVTRFFGHYFGREDRRVLLIGGGGFDPRSCAVPEALAPVLGDRLDCVLIREERPEPDHELRRHAEANLARLTQLLPSLRAVSVNAFAVDRAPVLGRSVVGNIGQEVLADYTDVILDFSALSIGASFPIAAYVLDALQAVPGTSFHLVVAANSAIDELIQPIAVDTVSPVHGFKGGWKTHATKGAAKLWMVPLAKGRRTILERIRGEVQPDDIAVILPFPARHPRVGDDLLTEYQEELREEAWGIGARDLVYAEETNPLDLYRTILGIVDRRRPVFEEMGGSLVVLSPVGSKVLAIGAMMAALERDLPVLHTESVGYEVDFRRIEEVGYLDTELVHVWLHGDVYSAGPLGRDP
jgi:hypothetical protein